MSKHNENLRFDRRLTRRRGWVSEQELARYEKDLPDVADEVEQIDPLGEATGAGAESAPDPDLAEQDPAPQAPGV